MRTTGAVITEIVEGWAGLTGWGHTWVRLEEIAKRQGLTPEEIQEALTELEDTDDPDFQAEEQPFRPLITDWEKQHKLTWRGEPAHLIKWGA